MFWSRLHLGICSQKSGPPPSGELQATPVCSIRMGCLHRPGIPPVHLGVPGHWLTSSLANGQPVPLSSHGPPQRPKAFQKALNAPQPPRKPWHCPVPLLMPPGPDGRNAGPGLRGQGSAPRHGLHLIWPFILNG